MDDKVSDYLPEMKGSAYDDVSIRQLLTMTSGVKWNEDYGDPNSDVARFNKHQPEEGVDALVSYMRRLPREAPAGTRWNYSTGETNLVGVLLGRATEKPLSTYLSEKIWVPAGMEQQATWILNRSGNEISGCCIQAATATSPGSGSSSSAARGSTGRASSPKAGSPTRRANARESASPNGATATSGGHTPTAASPRAASSARASSSTRSAGSSIASNANWGGGASDRVAGAAREAFYRAVQKAVDDEAAAGAASAASRLSPSRRD
jgi:CubicO group peptidase (beta-lactamase class C family)